MFGRGYRPFLLVLLGVSLYLTYLILHPFLNIIILAIILASISYPLYEKVLKAFGNRKTVSALLVVVMILFLILIPFSLFTKELIAQGESSISSVSAWLKEGHLEEIASHPMVQNANLWVEENLRVIDVNPEDIRKKLTEFSTSAGQVVLNKGADLVGNFFGLITDFFIMLFVVFYLLYDGREMVNKVKRLSPLPDDQDTRIINKIRAVARSVLLGNFFTALLQGLAGGIGLAICGIPGLFWGAVMGMASFIPLVGTALVWIPAVIYLLIVGDYGYAAFLAIWSGGLVGSIDNFVRPYLMRGEGGMSTFWIFLALLGGIGYFGLLGLIYGPLILAFAKVMLYIYEMEYDSLLTGDSVPPPAGTAIAVEAPPAGGVAVVEAGGGTAEVVAPVDEVED